MQQIYKFSVAEKIKDKLMTRLVYSNNIELYRLYSLYRTANEYFYPNKNPHIDHKRKIIFVHNPKVGGTSLRQILSLPKNGVYNHYTPTFLASKDLWENYFSIVAVRNPLDRFISSYFEIVNKNYTGYFRRKYPRVYDFSPKQFFETFKNEVFMAMPQYRYITHFLSTKPIDFVIRLENLNEDVKKLSKITGLKLKHKRLPHLNSRVYDKNIILKDKKLVKDIKEYFSMDYQIFGYDLNDNGTK